MADDTVVKSDVDESVGELSDDVLAKMLERPKVAPHVEKLLGKENVERLIAVVFHNEVIDLDYLYMSGELTGEESSQYVHSLPEFGYLLREIEEIADAMLEYFFSDKGRVLNWLDRSFVIHRNKDGGRRITVSEEQGLEKFRVMVTEFVDLFSYPYLQASYRESFIKKFVLKIITEVAIKFYKLCTGVKYGAEKKIVLEQYFNRMNLPSMSKNGAGLQIREFVQIEEDLSNLSALYRDQFAHLASGLCPDGAADLTELREKNLVKAESAGMLMRFRTCKEIVFESGCITTLKLLGVESGSKLTDEHCLVAIFHLDPQADDIANSRLILSLNFYGDVHAGFSKPEKYFDPLSCERLKSRIYDEIIKHLNTQPDRYEDLLIGHSRARKRIERVREGVGEAVGGVVGKTVEDGRVVSEVADGVEEVMDQGNGVAGKFGRWVRRGGEFLGRFRRRKTRLGGLSVGEEVAPFVADVADRTRVRLDMTRFDNLSRDEVLRITIRLLGKPVKISGSHHVFQNAEGQKGTIPMHSRQIVNRHILVDVLAKLGVLEDF